ncbi:MAG: hypothetical protein OEX80_09655, partial [Candidatus Aminicenantes bacterium]|nr:hypothetical protein [Candidatus Aminicenantes bacterium]
EVGWAVVDPAGAETFTPTTPEPINAPESLQQLYLTVLAEANGTSLTTGDVYIDGQLVGYTGSSFPVAEGTHRVFVNDFWEQGNTGNRYCFKYYTHDSTTYYPNPATWLIDEDMTVTAHFEKKGCPGDVNGDGIVDIVDIVICGLRIGIYRGLPEWTSIADLNCDGIIDTVDVVIVALNFGREY